MRVYETSHDHGVLPGIYIVSPHGWPQFHAPHQGSPQVRSLVSSVRAELNLPSCCLLRPWSRLSTFLARCADALSGYRVDVGRFPGWETVPS